MSMNGRKGNWNEIAGTPKVELAAPPDKELKKVKEKVLSEPPQKKSGRTKSKPRKPVAKA